MSSPILHRLTSSVPTSSSASWTLKTSHKCLHQHKHGPARLLATAASLLDVQVRGSERVASSCHSSGLHELSGRRHAAGAEDVEKEYRWMLAAALVSQSRNGALHLTSEEDSEQKQPGGSNDPDEPEISDQEWEIRTGTPYSASTLGDV